MFRLSTMKIHSPAGSMLTVRAMWSTNSGSVRVASNVGEMICAGHHVEAGGQRGGAMTRVLELLLGHAAGLDGHVGGVAFDGLERRRLIHAHRVGAVDRGLERGLEIGLRRPWRPGARRSRDPSPSC